MKWVKASEKKASMTSTIHIKDQHGMARLGNFYVDSNAVWFLHIYKTGLYEGFEVSEGNLHLYSWLDETPTPEPVDGGKWTDEDMKEAWDAAYKRRQEWFNDWLTEYKNNHY